MSRSGQWSFGLTDAGRRHRSDFRGDSVAVLSEMAARAEHPVLRARLADVSWLLERKRAQLGKTAISAYVEIIKQVDGGALKFRFDNEPGALKYRSARFAEAGIVDCSCDGADQTAASAPRVIVADLRRRAFEGKLPVPAHVVRSSGFGFRRFRSSRGWERRRVSYCSPACRH